MCQRCGYPEDRLMHVLGCEPQSHGASKARRNPPSEFWVMQDEPMPMQHRGTRIQMTVRLPYDEYREVAARARRRGWSMSDYVGWCVGKELTGKSNKRGELPSSFEADPLRLESGDSFGLAQAHPLSGHGNGNPSAHLPVRSFDD